MDSGSSPQIAMVTLPYQNTSIGQVAPSTSSPHPNVSANDTQPSRPLPSSEHALEQSGNYPNQYDWPAPANNVPQYTAPQVGCPGSGTHFSLGEADEEPWR